MNQHEKLNTVEFPARDLKATTSFFGETFGWTFEEFGPITAPSRGRVSMEAFIVPNFTQALLVALP
jgi:predicted enzyme related to lactoylglutathione lyase